MKFKLFEEYLILNESIGSAKATYLKTGKIQPDVFEKLTEIDPSKTKKYLDKICKYFLESNGTNFDELKEAIAKYDYLVEKNLTDKKDINAFKTFLELKNHVNEKNNAKSKTEVKNEIKHDGADIILDSEDVFVVTPKTHKASVFYGAGTKWCTAMTDDDTHFKRYNDEFFQKLYYVLFRKLKQKDPMYKCCITVYLDGKMDAVNSLNDEIDYKKVLKMGVDEKLLKPQKPSAGDIKNSWFTSKFKQWDGVYDVEGDVDIKNWNGNELPLVFGRVEGNFKCTGTKLKNLKGSPRFVGGNFTVISNDLISLVDGPVEVLGSYNVSGNKLKTLEGLAKKIGSHIEVSLNELESLKGIMPIVKGSLMCGSNNIKDLNESPSSIRGDFDIRNNKLTSLVSKLKRVGGSMDCSENELESLEGMPEKVGEYFDCSSNAKKFTEEEVMLHCKIKKNNISV